MTLVRSSVLLACIVGALARADPRPTNEEWKKAKAEDEAKAATADAKQSNMGAVDKVVKLLEGLQGKVLADGESEAASYNKFACFCKDGQKEKSEAIKEGKDQKASLAADINKLREGRKADDTRIADLEKVLKDTTESMDAAEKTNTEELGKYAKEKADLVSAIAGIEGALKVLKASKPSLVQLRSVSDSVRNALAMADAFGLGVDTMEGPAAAFLQDAPEVEIENYKFHSDSVIGTIESLLKTFRDKKAESDTLEVKRLQEHGMLMQEKTDTVKAKTLELSDTQKAKQNKIADIAENSQFFTTVSATLLDDETYLSELYSMCKNKAQTWDQRSKVRADELSAIVAAISLIKGAVSEKTSGATIRFAQRGVTVHLAEALAHDDPAMEAIEADVEETESHSSAFLQVRRVARNLPSEDASKEVVLRISKLFRTSRSALLTSLASQINTGAPKGLEKVKTLIEELIKRLEAEASSEATQKGWCDKSMGDANQKKISLSSSIDELNDSLAKTEADRRLLHSALLKLGVEIQELKDDQAKADKIRGEEKTENENAVKEAKEGRTAVEEAIKILADFYKAAADEKVSFAQGPKDEAPDAGFKSGEAYTGDQSGAEGVIGMLDVIKSDFVRTVEETEKAEAEAEQDHKAFTEETAASQKAKEEAEKSKKSEKDDLDSKFDTDKESLKRNADLLVSKVKELLELQKACVDTGMSYADRVARREEELGSLQKALCILSAYDQYGATAAKYDQCS